ncbi:MAG: hypothetical protein GXP25_19035 [Planctomycetes bacterium]|nr:hypothetical protein [Planctomycetota bacterium]
MIQWKCISCGATIKGPDHLEGKEVKCPKCKERIQLKAGGETEKSPASEEKKPDQTEQAKESDKETAPEKAKPEEKETGGEENEEKKEKRNEEPTEKKEDLGPLPGPAPEEEKADEDLPSAKDLLSEVKDKPGPHPAPAPAPAEPEAKKPPVEEKKISASPRPMVVERGLPINLIVGLIGLIAIAVTVYVIYQKNQVSKEQERTRAVVKDKRDDLDKIGDTVKKGEKLAESAEFDKAQETVKDVKSAIKRLISDVELELGAAVTDFAKEQRSRLIEDAEAVDEKVDNLLSRIEEARAETKEMTAFVAEREKELAEVDATIKKGKKEMTDTDYVSAQRTLRKAKSDAGDVIDEIEFEEVDITRPELKKQLADCKAKAKARQEVIEALLKSENIINGSRGLVEYKGKWMTPEQKAEATQPKKTPAAGTPAAAKAPSTFKPDDMEWLIDDFSGPLRWSRQTWGDPAELEIVEINADKMLLVRYQRGGEGKVAVGRGVKLDISSRGMLVVDVENRTNQPVPLCLAVVTDQFYESQGRSLRPGMNKGISFSLSDAIYKCAADGWLNYNHRIGSPNSLGQILFMIYPPGTVKEGTMIFDNIRMVAK